VSSAAAVAGGEGMLKPSGIFTLYCCVEGGWKWQFSLTFLSLPWQFLEAV